MKKILALLGLGLLAGAVASPALATPITITSPGAHNGDDVGSIDSLYGYGNTGNSNPTTETAFANYLTGNSYGLSDFDKFCDGTSVCGNMLLTTSQAGVFAIYLPSAPQFFMVKTGNGSSFTGGSGAYTCSPGGNTKCEHFLFQNLGSTSFLVFRMTDMGFGANATGKISHVDSFGTTTTSVPEPGTLGMFGVGIGLLGLFLGLRRRRAC